MLKDRNPELCRNHAGKCDEGEQAIPPIMRDAPDSTT
jgi:hypothetical protein